MLLTNLKERSGELFAKVTLGALVDDAPAPSLAQTRALQGVCKAVGFPEDDVIDVDTLSIVQYECRSLEREKSSKDIALQGEEYEECVPSWQSIAQEVDDVEDYFPKLQMLSSRWGCLLHTSSHPLPHISQTEYQGEAIQGGLHWRNSSCLPAHCSSFIDACHWEVSQGGGKSVPRVSSLHCSLP